MSLEEKKVVRKRQISNAAASIKHEREERFNGLGGSLDHLGLRLGRVFSIADLRADNQS
ncbi:unnamed protein product [Rhizoctonia solani]|uniref:Uncharacterized protein n=1 Tax=Rhizoctonia solani TaxID=456999 RepID=A0A8H3GE92_9AGAM|nr:unnamed protein product [Rhizoctonia solani]